MVDDIDEFIFNETKYFLAQASQLCSLSLPIRAQLSRKSTNELEKSKSDTCLLCGLKLDCRIINFRTTRKIKRNKVIRKKRAFLSIKCRACTEQTSPLQFPSILKEKQEQKAHVDSTVLAILNNSVKWTPDVSRRKSKLERLSLQNSSFSSILSSGGGKQKQKKRDRVNKLRKLVNNTFPLNHSLSTFLTSFTAEQ